ncbi:MAG TPA: hypothetical protein VFH58_17180 [Acidimicrobiales bacterium]|nr:hypothetical protein [Acidimicrobiales bacterium]
MTASVLVVDAANVVGSRPDGWWKDRQGAAQRLLERIGSAVAAERVEGPVVVVLEGRAREAEVPGGQADLTVVRAPGSGDDAIVAVVSEAGGERATVVTADRGLGERVRRLGARVESPGRFLNRLG